MPKVVYVLAVAVFAQGTSEFMVSGLLGPIAADLGVSLGSAGLLTSLFAAGMVVGAPLMAVAAGRVPVRLSAAAFLGAFCVAHVIGAVATSFAVLLVVRVIAAVANAGFLAVALAALPALVGPERIGRATSVVVAGVTVACVVGVPAGTALGQVQGWRSAFWAVALVGLAVLVPLWALLDRLGDAADPGPRWREWLVVGDRGVGVAVAAGCLVNAGTFAAFTYLGTIASGLPGGVRWVPVALALFGLGSFAGVTLAGRYGDRHRRAIIVGGAIVLTGVWLLAAAVAATLGGVLAMAALSGALAFGVGSTLIATIVAAASPSAPHIAGALATTAFNIGAVLGPMLAGPLVDHTGRPITAWWASAACTALAGVVAAGHDWHTREA
ncbi:Cmx/CmrA family chloramphenicol efflux MFS transporter [Nocardia sp. NPDC003482]